MQRIALGLVICGLLAGQAAFAKAQENAAESKPKAGTQTIVAEGVGATADEALKDAYRNAVRQVVGAVVDAETLVKNDEVIDDKVLTYSDGFIKGYEEVDGSRKVKDGLHRIKIKAQVERRSVIAKLKAANVSTKEVDGKGLFAEAVTQLDAEKDAAALLKKQFEGFPQSCLTATVIGKPEIVEKTAEQAKVKLTVQIEPDLKAYKAFSDKLIPILEKLAKDKGEFTAKFEEQDGDLTDSRVMEATNGENRQGTDLLVLKRWIPRVFSSTETSFSRFSEKTLTLAVAAGRTKKGDSIDYRYFVIDPSLKPMLVAIASRAGNGNLQLLDTGRNVVISQRFKVETLVSSFGHPSLINLPQAYGMRGDGPVFELGLSGGEALSSEVRYPEVVKQRHENNASIAQMFLVSSTFFESNTIKLRHRPLVSTSVNLTIGLRELQSVQSVKAEIIFDE